MKENLNRELKDIYLIISKLKVERSVYNIVLQVKPFFVLAFLVVFIGKDMCTELTCNMLTRKMRRFSNKKKKKAFF